jgi:RHS repeat-associated protein
MPGRPVGLDSFRLYYNSSQFEVNLLPPDPPNTGYKKQIVQSDESGFRYGLGYGLVYKTRPSPAPVCSTNVYLDTKFLLRTPDGGLKELNMRGQPDTSDGYYPIDEKGRKNCSIGGGAPLSSLVLYTSDSSFLRLELPTDGVNDYSTKTWSLYLPNGSKAEGQAEFTSKFVDANGFSMTNVWAYNPTTDTLTASFVEDQAPQRSVTLTIINPYQAHADTITWQGYQQTLTTTVNWSSVPVGPYSYPCQSTGYPECTYSSGGWIVTSISIPVADPFFPRSYQFEYRDNAHCGALSCYGELGKITFPPPTSTSFDKLSVSYQYALEGLPLDPAKLDNPVKQKTVSYTEHTSSGNTARTETTNITINDSDSTFTNPSGGITKHYFPDKNYLGSPLRGLVYRTDYPDGSRVQRLWWRNRTNTMDSTDPGNPYVRIEVKSVPNASGVPTKSAAKQFTVDRNGNPRIIEEYSWGDPPSASQITSLPTNATLVRKTVNTYFNSTTDAGNGTTPTDETNAYWNPASPRQRHLLKRQEVRNSAEVVKSASQFEYDSSTVNGNKTAEFHWDSTKGAIVDPLTDSGSTATTYTYTCSGRLDTVTDPNGYKTKYTYDGNCLFPQTQYAAYQRPEQRQTTFTYDTPTGLLLQTTDADNSISTIFDYDILGRRTSVREAAGSTDEAKTVIVYDDPRRRVITKRDRLTTGDGKLISVQHFDSRGLNWLSQEIEDGTLPSDTDTTSGIKTEHRTITVSGFSYDLVSNPFRTAATQDSMGWTLTRRDAAGRLNQVTTYAGAAAPGPWAANTAILGTTSTGYNGDTTTTTDPAGKVSTVQVDALGRVVYATAGAMSTTNAYDILDNLSTVTQGTQVRSFTYSSLSLLESSTQPENGTTSYTYDKNGNLLTRTDARGWAQTYTAPTSPPNEKAYDGLGRPRFKTVRISPATSNNTQTVSWSYDTATKGKGKLTSVTNGDTTVTYSAYDSLGRVLTHKQTTAGIDYPFAYTYFRNDEPKSITYPSGRTVNYTLDDNGRPSAATATARQYITATTYNPGGSLRTLDLSSSNLRASWTNINARLQSGTIKVEKAPFTAPTTLLDLGYTYVGTSGSDNNGNPRTHSINDGAATRNQTYTYDSANRLASANETGGFTQTYNYDQFNNRWATPGDSLPGGVFTPTSSAYYSTVTNRSGPTDFQAAYDAAGNLTAQNFSTVFNSFSWDAEGKKTDQTLTSNGAPFPIIWSYDGLGQRVKKDHSANGLTVFVYDAFGNLAAEYSLSAIADCATCYIFADILGSTRLVTDSAGTAVNRFDYMPFGEGIWSGQPWSNGRTGSVYGGPSSIKPQFTGSYRDDQAYEWSGDYFGARYFNRAYGRFVSPDENLVDQNTADPLSWNLFTYVRNNPLRNTDPTGQTCAAIIGDNGETTGYRDVHGPGPMCDSIKSTTQSFTVTEEGAVSTEIGGVFFLIGPTGGYFPAGERGLVESDAPFLLAGALRSGAGAVLRGRQPTPQLSPQQILQELTTAANTELAANPSLMKALLSPKQIAAAKANKGIAAANYGKALEKFVAGRIKDSPELGAMFKYAGGRSQPDFIGIGRAAGMNFDITTNTSLSIVRHLARPGYGNGLNLSLYIRPSNFKFE